MGRTKPLRWIILIAIALLAAPARAQPPATQPASRPASRPAAPALVMPAWSEAPEDEEDEEDEKHEVPTPAKRARARERGRWRGSRLSWGHAVWESAPYSVGGVSKSDPRYSQLLSLEPAFWPVDGLRLGLRLVLAFELSSEDDATGDFGPGSAEIDFERLSGPSVLTTSGSGTSDLHLDASYSLTIPVVRVRVEPGLRPVFPISRASRLRSRLFGLAPGLTLRRRIALRGEAAFWLPSLDLAYAFRAYKYFHEHDTAQLSPAFGSGFRNVSWHLENALELRLQLLRGLDLALAYHHFDDLLYELEGGTSPVEGAPEVNLGSALRRASLDWLIVDLRYELLRWLWLSAGVSTLVRRLSIDSGLQGPSPEQETRFHLAVTLPLDRLAAQVRGWARPR